MHKIVDSNTLRIEEFANNYIVNTIKPAEQYFITKVYSQDNSWYVHILVGDDKNTLVFSDDGTLLFTEPYVWI